MRIDRRFCLVLTISLVWAALVAGLFFRVAMGGGDVKLMAAFGALPGPGGVLTAAVFAALIGALCALGALLRGRRAIPYAPALAAGACAALLGGL
jgi:prepilin signal peptidase PulO-like enzyme (type II secretory pathway)